MHDSLGPPSEFGGKIQRNGIQPPPHLPTASEKLSLVYRTGDVDGTKDTDGGMSFAGLLDTATLRAVRETEGVSFEKGQVWLQMEEQAATELAAMADEVPDVT